MKRIFILLGLLVALQLSAQNPDFKGGDNQQPRFDKQGQVCAQSQGPHQLGGPGMGQPGEAHQQPPFMQPREQGDFMPFALDQLSDKDREVVEGYMKDLHKVLDQKENELFLHKAELRYLTHVEKPDLSQIASKLDEIGKLESAIQLEKIKFELKVKEQFPALSEGFKKGPSPQAPEAGAPTPNDRPGKAPAKKK